MINAASTTSAIVSAPRMRGRFLAQRQKGLYFGVGFARAEMARAGLAFFIAGFW
ncbi:MULTISPECIES: hypothetical protein [Saccharopolyspora]|uniref:hypothetical protein n=1 Tax=Saccharopolyspora TaxID=1835 RepID=UPI001F288F59|nr:hypothetical protein [Saccharopolyspora elongata]